LIAPARPVFFISTALTPVWFRCSPKIAAALNVQFGRAVSVFTKSAMAAQMFKFMFYRFSHLQRPLQGLWSKPNSFIVRISERNRGDRLIVSHHQARPIGLITDHVKFKLWGLGGLCEGFQRSIYIGFASTSHIGMSGSCLSLRQRSQKQEKRREQAGVEQSVEQSRAYPAR